MTPRFQADADFNEKIVRGLRRREPSVDFLNAGAGGVIGLPDADVFRGDLDIGAAIEAHWDRAVRRLAGEINKKATDKRECTRINHFFIRAYPVSIRGPGNVIPTEPGTCQ